MSGFNVSFRDNLLKIHVQGEKLNTDNFRFIVNYTCPQKDYTKCFFWPPFMENKQKVESLHILTLLFENIRWYLE